MSPTSSGPRAPMVVGAIILIAVATIGTIVAWPHMLKPTVESRLDAFAIGLDSPQVGGTMWMNVTTATPIDVMSGRDIELTIEIASDQDVAPTLIFGGAAASSVTACDGNGVFIDPDADLLKYEDLSFGAQEIMLRYEQRRPATGYIFGFDGQDRISEDLALPIVTAREYRADVVTLTRTGTRVWSYSDEASVEYPVHEATLTCTFDAEAFVAWFDGLAVFRTPDLVASVASLGEEGPVRVDCRFQFANNEGLSRPVQTFSKPREFVDDESGDRLLEVTNYWWMRNADGRRGFEIAGGIIQFEDKDAPGIRIFWRLCVAFLISFAVGLSVLVIRRTLYYWM